jgi:serine/threonine protein kinase
MTLADRVKVADRPLNPDKYLRWHHTRNPAMSINIHRLGLRHNDTSPRNIMLKSDDTPVIIAFHSCRKEGHELFKAGGWCKSGE